MKDLSVVVRAAVGTAGGNTRATERDTVDPLGVADFSLAINRLEVTSAVAGREQLDITAGEALNCSSLSVSEAVANAARGIVAQGVELGGAVVPETDAVVVGKSNLGADGGQEDDDGGSLDHFENLRGSLDDELGVRSVERKKWGLYILYCEG